MNDIETQAESKNNSTLESKSDHIPFYMKVLFSLPAFGKMSCLIILK